MAILDNRKVLIIGTVAVATAAVTVLSVVKPRVPPEPVRTFAVAGHALLGEAGVGAEVVVFLDYNCPACKAFETEHLPPLKEKLVKSGKMHLYVFQSPFLAQSSLDMAVAAECALEQNQGAFWRYHELLMARTAPEGSDVSATELLTLAGRAKVNTPAFRTCLNDPVSSARTRVKRDLQIHESVNMLGTPTVFVNGIRTPAGSKNIADTIAALPTPRSIPGEQP